MATPQRELELELEVWRGRMNLAQTTANAINLQTQLLQLQAKECNENIARLELALKEHENATANPAVEAPRLRAVEDAAPA